MNDDYRWFLEHYHELYEEYGESYIAIKDKKVIGAYRTYADGVKATKKSESLGSFIVQKCGRDETSYTNYISSMNFMLF